jgi:radical SAM superfamily enzyme YgiQ (UPF0313 family)
MGKPGHAGLITFRDLFRRLTAEADKEQFLTYYLIAAHPGCTASDMEAAQRFASRELAIRPEQVQLFTPTPSTISTLMYHTKRDPFSGRTLFVEQTAAGRELQKKILVAKKGLLRYGIPGLNQTTKEEESWVRTRTSKKKPRRSLPKR